MPRDFAKKTRKHNSASRFNQKKTNLKIPVWTWILAGLLIVIIGAILIAVNYQSTINTVSIPVKQETKSAKSRYQAVPAEKITDADFNFHNILQNKIVEVPVQAESDLKTTTSTLRYIMQCGSFRKITLAETLKARIALNGFTAKITATDEIGGNRWFRVSLGPYTSKRTAESERHQLERNDINNCRIW